jgi:hypothetical protein
MKKGGHLDTGNFDQQPATKWRRLDLGRVDEQASQFPKQVIDISSCLSHVLLWAAID